MVIERKLLAVFVPVLLLVMPGCREERLTADECATIRARELSYLSDLLGEGGADPILSGAVSDNAIAQCVSGKMYVRKDYECIVSAKTSLATSQCMAQAHEKAER